MNNYLNKLGIALLCIAVLSACSSTPATDTSAAQSDSGTASKTAANTGNESVSGQAQASGASPEKAKYEDDDYATDWTNMSPTLIRLNGTAASIDGSGAKATDKSVAITAAGTYVFSGRWEGQIVVDVPDTVTVRLVLNGVNIYSSDKAPIYIKEAEKAILTLAEGTENIVSDGETYAAADASDDEPNAAVFSKADLTVNGTGKLIVYGNYNNGLTSKDDLKITGGTIEIHAADDGLMGRDLVAVKDGTILIEAGGDGIKSTNDTEQSKGNIAIEGGSFDIKAGSDGIQSAVSLRIDGGDFDIVSGGGSAKGTKKAEGDRNGPMGNQEAASTQSDAADSKSAKALKAASGITATAGTFGLDSADDAVHSNGSIAIAGGEMKITSGDDGIHADASIAITGGSIDIVKSYEGIESAEITIADGDIRITAGDDGVNVAGGNDGSSIGGRPGQNQFAASGGNKLAIHGGSITVDAAGDGLDANGSIVMTGGSVTVNGPTASNNGALDYDGTFDMSGGFLVAAGSSGMAAAPSETSGQLSVIMNYSQSQKAGATVLLKDGDGNVAATFAPTKAYQTVVISSPDLKKEKTYTLYSGETKVVDFNISNAVTWLSESGVTAAGSGGRGGPGGNPGMGGGRMRP